MDNDTDVVLSRLKRKEMMANDTAAQLARIRAKAEGMGLHWPYFKIAVTHMVMAEMSAIVSGNTNEWLATAESLLAVLDPDAFVVGVMSPSYWGEILNCKVPVCNHHCELYNCGGCGEDEQPDSRCPGPAPDDHEWVIVGRRKVKVDG